MNVVCAAAAIALAAATAYHEFWYAHYHDRHGPANWIALLALSVTVGLIPVLRHAWHDLQAHAREQARYDRAWRDT